MVRNHRRPIVIGELRLESRPDEQHSVHVELWRRVGTAGSGERFVGSAQSGTAVRAAAAATLAALYQAVGPSAQTVQLLDVHTFEALDAMLVGVALSGTRGGQTVLLMGFSRIRNFEVATAAARAVLNATNRLLDIG